MYSRLIWMLLMAVHLFFNGELMADNPDCETLADHPIGINTYIGKWADVRDPSLARYQISNVGGQLKVETLAEGEMVSGMKLNAHSLSFVGTSSEINPQAEIPNSLKVNLFPDIRSNAHLFCVNTIKFGGTKQPEVIKMVSLMTRVKNGNKQPKGNTGISNQQSKSALENVYTKQWDLSQLQSADAANKVLVQITATNNDVQAIFTHGSNKAQVPAKIVGYTVTISMDSNTYSELKSFPLIFLSGRKYYFELVPLYGNKNDLILKLCSIKDNDQKCVYFMASSIGK